VALRCGGGLGSAGARAAPPVLQRDVFGPFHRLESPTQNTATLIKQVLSGELWGSVPTWGGPPYVKAIAGALDKDSSGFEFWAFQPPSNGGPKPQWRWPGPYVVVDSQLDIVKLQIAFVRVSQDLHP
jgi:hypothetical protein